MVQLGTFKLRQRITCAILLAADNGVVFCAGDGACKERGLREAVGECMVVPYNEVCVACTHQ